MRILLCLYCGIQGHIEFLRADWTEQTATGMFVPARVTSDQTYCFIRLVWAYTSLYIYIYIYIHTHTHTRIYSYFVQTCSNLEFGHPRCVCNNEVKYNEGQNTTKFIS